MVKKKVKKKKPAKKNGRPSKFKPEYEEQAYKLCLLGATDEQMADFFGVTEKTVNNWKRRKGFLQSIKRGKIAADANVAESLYKRACGYEHPETKVFCNSDGDITTHEMTKHYPPDTAAAFIWLKNRAGWRDKQDVEHSGTVNLAQAIHKAKSK